MALPVWPSTVPHVSAQPPNALDQPYTPPVVTEVEDGPELMRPQSQTVIERYAYAIKMTHAQFNTFKTFARDTLGQCTAHFSMMVNVLGGACVDRRVYIDGGNYRAEPRGPVVFVSFRLCVFPSVAAPGPAVPSITASPVVTGNRQVGQTLSCTTGTWTNTPTSYAYQWRRNSSNISGATGSTYALVGADTANNINCLVTATNAEGSGVALSNTLSIDGVATNTGAPVISGLTTVGSTLTSTTGTWTYSPTAYAYQWKRNGTNIGSATASTYLLVSTDAGTSITCAVTATNPQGVSLPATSNALLVAGVPVNSIAPVISGTPTIGSVLSSNTGTWTNAPTGYTYQWRRNGADIGSATGNTYLLVLADVGTSITCAVTATNPQGVSAAAISNALTIAGNVTTASGTANATGFATAMGRAVLGGHAGNAAGTGTATAVGATGGAATSSKPMGLLFLMMGTR